MMSVHVECIKCGRITHIELAKDIITKKAFEVKFSWICPKCVKKIKKRVKKYKKMTSLGGTNEFI